MKKLTLALAATAIVAASAPLASPAEAGGRGRLHFHLHHLHILQQHRLRSYHDDDDDHRYVRRRVVKKPVIVKQAAKPVAVVKYADGEGRRFDTVSKVWFDGEGVCWKGDKAFAFKGGTWFYGNARWIETSAGWGVDSGDAPRQVSCEGIKAFEASLKGAAKTAAVTKPVEEKPAKVETAEAVDKPAKAVTTTPTTPSTGAKPTECKKYFPSVGEMVSVPCGE